MRLYPAILVTVFLFAQPVHAQTRQEQLTVQVVPGDTGRALLAAFEFVRVIARDSVVLANCDRTGSVPKVRAGESFVELPDIRDPDTYCRSGAIRSPTGALVIIESFELVRRDVVLPVREQVSFAINVQVQYGRSHREWHALTVRPAGAVFIEGRSQARDWRVSSWRITQWMSH